MSKSADAFAFFESDEYAEALIGQGDAGALVVQAKADISWETLNRNQSDVSSLVAGEYGEAIARVRLFTGSYVEELGEDLVFIDEEGDE